MDQIRGQNEEKKGQKEGFEGARPKEGAKKGVRGPLQKGVSLATLLQALVTTRSVVISFRLEYLII